MELVLSLFHGADLFGRGFEQEGFCVVRAAEIELGFDARDFKPTPNKFDGIIAGTPCQDFSRARRSAPTGNGLAMLKEFTRIVLEAQPKWFLLENVPLVPDIRIEGYTIQRFDLNAKECGLNQNRPRHFQFGSKEGNQLWVERIFSLVPSQLEGCCMASKKKKYQSFADVCELQGLPRDFRLEMLSINKNYQVIGNGVPPPMARLIAQSIRLWAENISPVGHILGEDSNSPSHILNKNLSRSSHVSDKKNIQDNHISSSGPSQNLYRAVTLCRCGCGRRVTGKQKAALPACRKRLERKRKRTGLSHTLN